VDTEEEKHAWAATVRLEGTYHSLLTFIAQLGDGSLVHTLKNLSIRTEDDPDPAVTIAAECTIVVLLRPPGQRHEAVAGDVESHLAPATLEAIPGVARDPFVRVRRPVASTPVLVADQPRPAGLAGLAIADATLRGTLETPRGSVAFLVGTDGRTHVVRAGDELFDGVVVSVAPNALVVRPKYPGDGPEAAEGDLITMVRLTEPTK
jgi:hypothetical protein